jgi:hypothetical protein
MRDRFEQTAADASAAVAHAAERAAAARRRRQELQERLATLRAQPYCYGPTPEIEAIEAARERLASAQASCARARERADQAVARARALRG